MIKKFFEAAPNTLVDAFSVTAIQGRLSNTKDQYGDTASGNITISTIGGSLLITSTNVPVDLERLRAEVEALAVPQLMQAPTVVTNNSTSPSGAPVPGAE